MKMRPFCIFGAAILVVQEVKRQLKRSLSRYNHGF